MNATVLPPLEQVDPAQAWQPWQPTPADPWSRKWAGHLYRRAAFGATHQELETAVKQGLPATLERLLKGDPKVAGPDWEEAQESAGRYAIRTLTELRAWWLNAIVNGPHPLQEKMTLFWHNHLATSNAKVQRPLLMWKQNVLLRKHALGKFRPLLLNISHDPAMLIWLDSNSNVKGKPNENYARELMELFSLGVGHYTEKDIREAARAFTGWSNDDDQFEFDSSQHDDRVKTVLGQKGNWNGDDIVRIVLEQPCAALFLTRKLYHYFVSETVVPPDSLLAPLADSFRKSDYDIGALVKTILSSRHFFSAHAYRQRIKDPVEFTVGTVRACWKAEEASAIKPGALVVDVGAMGMELFAPPNVKGWPGGKAWLNTATVLARSNFAQRVAFGLEEKVNEPLDFAVEVTPAPPNSTQPTKEVEPPEPPGLRDVVDRLGLKKDSPPQAFVDRLVDVLLPGGISQAARGKLMAYVGEGKPDARALRRRVREAAHAVMTMPEYQLA
jgi:uncharacterized protein (DUF1800 family)